MSNNVISRIIAHVASNTTDIRTLQRCVSVAQKAMFKDTKSKTTTKGIMKAYTLSAMTLDLLLSGKSAKGMQRNTRYTASPMTNIAAKAKQDSINKLKAHFA